MVQIHFKRSERMEFLVETPAATSTDELLTLLAEGANLRLRVERLAQACTGLADHGPLQPEGIRGLTSPETRDPAMETLNAEERRFLEEVANSGGQARPDKTGWRVGVAPPEKAAETLRAEVAKALELVSKTRADEKRIISSKELSEAIALLKGAVMICYPGYYALPAWDPARAILEDLVPLPTLFPDAEWVDEKASALWWAKKELVRGKPLSSFIGANEKTKIVVKIAQRGKGAPLAEPPIDKETHSKMLAFYHKKQEEAKKLDEANDDEYLSSEWANPKMLKNQLVTGGKGISFR